MEVPADEVAGADRAGPGSAAANRLNLAPALPLEQRVRPRSMCWWSMKAKPPRWPGRSGHALTRKPYRWSSLDDLLGNTVGDSPWEPGSVRSPAGRDWGSTPRSKTVATTGRVDGMWRPGGSWIAARGTAGGLHRERAGGGVWLYRMWVATSGAVCEWFGVTASSDFVGVCPTCRPARRL